MFMLNPYVWYKRIKAQSQKDQKIIFAYIKPSVSQVYGS